MNVDLGALRRRWDTTWTAVDRRIGRSTAGARRDAEREALLAAWAEPHRAYHSLAHLSACLSELDRVAATAADPALLAVALWYHDAIYDTQAADNEARSATWAAEAASALGLPEADAERLRSLVLATRHDAVPADPDAALLVDIDLAVLGRPPEVYDRYEADIRREYAWVPEDAFRAGRSRVLRSLLDRPRIYTTAPFAGFEAPARANLTRALGALGG